MKTRRLLLLGLLALSGASALVYQVVWMRWLILRLGSSTDAVAIILAVFMGGLGGGAILLGRRADRSRNPLLGFALLEAGVGLSALVVPGALMLLDRAGAGLFQAAAGSLLAVQVLRISAAILVLIIPTLLMGATLPWFARAWVTSSARIGRGVGLVYGINTLGAVGGTLVCSFAMIPLLGLLGAHLAGVAGDLLVAVGTLALGWQVARPAGEQTPQPRGKETQPDVLPLPLAATLYAAVGFAALGYEVVWNRLLSLALGSTLHGFALMLAAFLTGIALGGLLFPRLPRAIADSRRAFVAFLAAIGMAHLVMALAIRVPFASYFWLFEKVRDQSLLFHAGLYVVVTLYLLVPTLLSGLAFPWVHHLCVHRVEDVGRGVGLFYGVNTIAGIAGVTTASLLIPLVGSLSVLKLLAAGLALIALVSGVMAQRKGRRVLVPAAVVTAVVLAAGLALPEFPRQLMITAPYVYAPLMADPASGADFDPDILFFEEGRHALVSVAEDHGGYRRLQINGKADATDAGDMSTQYLLGHLPALAHPAPGNVLIIGMGSGATAGAVLQHPSVKKVTIIEIEQAVVDAARYFNHINLGVFDDPRVEIRVEDARTSLAWRPEEYDVIISEPSNPWITGVANLFTKEFFEICRSRLAPEGVIGFWVEYYDLNLDQARSVLATVQSVFPRASVWQTSATGDVLVMSGKDHEIVYDYEPLRRRMAGEDVARSFRALGLRGTPAELADFFLMGPGDLTGFTEGRRLLTDDDPYLEWATATTRWDVDYLDFDRAVVDWYGQGPEARYALVPMTGLRRERAESYEYPFANMWIRSSDWQGNASYVRTFSGGVAQLFELILMSNGSCQAQLLVGEGGPGSASSIEQIARQLHRDVDVTSEGTTDVGRHSVPWTEYTTAGGTDGLWAWWNCEPNRMAVTVRASGDCSTLLESVECTHPPDE